MSHITSPLNTSIVNGAGILNCGAVPGRVEVCNAKYGKTGWLGVASIWASGEHITKATVKLNDTYFSTSTYNTVAWKNMVMCQEVGHTLGLAHQDESFNNTNKNTCMDYTNLPASNQFPNENDYYQLQCIYTQTATSNSHCSSFGHIDTINTVTSSTSSTLSRVNDKPATHNTPAVADEIDTSNSAEWGDLVSSTHGGFVETYERDLGLNKKLIIHVIWAK